jgi:DNA modification methylase
MKNFYRVLSLPSFCIISTYFSGHWDFAGAKQRGYLAIFTEELSHLLIKNFAFRSDTVLVPFMGSWTTSFGAKNLRRNSI